MVELSLVVDDGNGFKFRLMIIELGTSYRQSDQHTGAYVGENMGDISALLSSILSSAVRSQSFQNMSRIKIIENMDDLEH